MSAFTSAPCQVTLECEECAGQEQVEGTNSVHGQPVLDWWYRKAKERCAACRALDLVDVDTPSSFNGKTETSRDAAEATLGGTASLRRRVLTRIVECGGLTRDELVVEFSRTWQSVTPRVTELKKWGWIVDSGEVRRTRSGCGASVMVASDAGLYQLEHEEGA